MINYFNVSDVYKDVIYEFRIDADGDLQIDDVEEGSTKYIQKKQAIKLAKRIIKGYKKEKK